MTSGTGWGLYSARRLLVDTPPRNTGMLLSEDGGLSTSADRGVFRVGGCWPAWVGLLFGWLAAVGWSVAAGLRCVWLTLALGAPQDALVSETARSYKLNSFGPHRHAR